jgi:hypothetical protein
VRNFISIDGDTLTAIHDRQCAVIPFSGVGIQTPAERILFADFELHANDCPVGPGNWVDRIGGLVVNCVGSDDWVRESNGHVGVTKSDVCYATFGEDVARKIAFEAQTQPRTIVAIVSGWEDFLAAPLFGWLSPDTTSKTWHFGQVSGRECLVVSRFGGGYGSSRVRPNDPTSGVVVAMISYTQDDTTPEGYYGILSTTDVWTQVNYNRPARNECTGEFFRRLVGDTSIIADTTTRGLRMLSLASAPGLLDVATIKAWAQEMGVPWS